jgi:hypothetical protein
MRGCDEWLELRQELDITLNELECIQLAAS